VKENTGLRIILTEGKPGEQCKRYESVHEVSRVKWKAGTSPASFPRIAIFVRTGTMRRFRGERWMEGGGCTSRR
jgi:hypothetical protein